MQRHANQQPSPPPGGPLVFDDPAYSRSLPHLGRPSRGLGLPWPVLVRPIPGGAGRRDAIGPWPYASAPDPAAVPAALDRLRAAGLVSLTTFLRPDAGASPAALRAAGLSVTPLKEHYVRDPALPPPPPPSRRTRRNLALGARRWRAERLPPGPAAAAACAACHEHLARRRRLGAITRVPAAHFEALVRLPGVEVLAAVDADGPGAVLVAARGAGETHLLHLCSEPRALRSCAAHLLMSDGIARWGGDGPVYLGGAPDGPDGPGVARFKARWANRTAAVLLATAVLDREAYDLLCPSPSGGGGGFFPAYRAAA